MNGGQRHQALKLTLIRPRERRRKVLQMDIQNPKDLGKKKEEYEGEKGWPGGQKGTGRKYTEDQQKRRLQSWEGLGPMWRYSARGFSPLRKSGS